MQHQESDVEDNKVDDTLKREQITDKGPPIKDVRKVLEIFDLVIRA